MLPSNMYPVPALRAKFSSSTPAPITREALIGVYEPTVQDVPVPCPEDDSTVQEESEGVSSYIMMAKFVPPVQVVLTLS